jgi:uncharacterized damage-inducible protein DinB
MQATDLLLDTYSRITPLMQSAIQDVSDEQLTKSPEDKGNTLAWLIWHVGRVQDVQMSDLMNVEQIWTEGDWAEQFGLKADPSNSGYGHSFAEMCEVQPKSAQALIDYGRACTQRSLAYIKGLNSTDLDRVIDESWNPPVTVGIRLVSIADDCLQHLGQANYLRGLLS